MVAMLNSPTPCHADLTGPRGIYVLGNGRDNAGTPADERLANLRDYDFTDGYTLRVQWEDVDLGGGVYDFDVINQAMAQLQSNQHATRLNFELLLLSPPQHLLENATETWEHFKAGMIPVPWDSVVQQGYADLITALASHPVHDTTVGANVPLAEHSSLNSINASVPGISSIRDNGGSSGVTKLVDLPSYDRQIFVDTVVQAVALNRNAFADQFGFLGYFSMTDSENANFGGKTLNETLIETLLTEFNNPGQPHVGLFQELLSDIGPNPAGTLGTNLLAVADDTYIMFQALSAWTAPFNPNHVDKVTSMNPATGIDLGFNNYGATFYELYIADIDGAQNGEVDAAGNLLIEDLRDWHDFLEALAADFNLDGQIDAADLAQWQTDFHQNDLSDADRDGDTDGADFLNWQTNFAHQTPAPPVQSITVPEPTTNCLLAITILATWLIQPNRRQKHHAFSRSGTA